MHWTRTLSQDSCSRNEPMHHAHLSPLSSVLPISLTGLYKVMKKMPKMQKYRGTYAQFFLSVGLCCLFFFGGGGLTRGS